MTIRGNAVSPGYALGPAFLYKPAQYKQQPQPRAGGPAESKAAFEHALEAAARELDELIARFAKAGDDKGAIFAAQKEILYDEELLEEIGAAIGEGMQPGDAVGDVYEQFIALLGAAKDPLIAARTADLRDVRNRLLRVLSGGEQSDLSGLSSPVIILANDLLPSDTATLNREFVLGIVTELGSATSHTAILANSYGIPAVVGAAGALESVKDGQLLALDAVLGTVVVEPGETQRKQLEQKQQESRAAQRSADSFLDKPGQTADGELVEIGLNIGSPTEAAALASADFVGLFRTEFLYMQSGRAPSEQEQFEAYKAALAAANKKPVTLRTLDIGGDKTLPYLTLPNEQNPFLGKRALRLCFEHLELFKTQLRAALRAAAFGELWVMLPMVGSLDDIRRAREIFGEVKLELGADAGAAKFGIMIEIPAIAAVADLAAKEVDFASVGTNDLCQYLCAVDRMNPELTGYYQSLSPAMVRTLAAVSSAFNAAKKPVSVCGELAGDTMGAALLVGLGFNKLSMSGGKIGAIKAMLAQNTGPELREMAARAKSAATQAEVVEIIRRQIERRQGEAQ